MATVKESQYQIYVVFILHMRHVEIFDHNGKSSLKIKKNGRTKRIPCFKIISFFFQVTMVMDLMQLSYFRVATFQIGVDVIISM